MASWGKCDYKELEKFRDKIEKLSKGNALKLYQECAKELAARLLAKVIKRTPVGSNSYENVEVDGKSKRQMVKNGGTLRRGWTTKTEKEAEAGVSTDAKSWANSLKITKIGNVYQIEVINPVHYASYVEFGHRQEPGRYVPAIGKKLKKAWVDGIFMLTISEKELEKEIPKIIESKIMKFLEECFNGE